MIAKSSKRSSVISHARATLEKQIAAALADLKGNVVSDSSIHSSRKKIKKARAILRLIRDELPVRTFRSENLLLRDAARPLNTVRDAKILMDALDRLAKKDESVKPLAIKTFRRTLFRARNLTQISAMTAKAGTLSHGACCALRKKHIDARVSSCILRNGHGRVRAVTPEQRGAQSAEIWRS